MSYRPRRPQSEVSMCQGVNLEVSTLTLRRPAPLNGAMAAPTPGKKLRGLSVPQLPRNGRPRGPRPSG